MTTTAGMNIHQSGANIIPRLIWPHTSETFLPYCPQEAEDGTPYHTTKPLKCQAQSDAFLHLLKEMSKHPQEYVTAEGRVTTNSIEAFHGLALKYHGKRIDLHHTHYTCKTNMAICHKVFIHTV